MLIGRDIGGWERKGLRSEPSLLFYHVAIQTVPSKENLSQPKHPSCGRERDLFIPGAQNTLSELPDD